MARAEFRRISAILTCDPDAGLLRATGLEALVADLPRAAAPRRGGAQIDAVERFDDVLQLVRECGAQSGAARSGRARIAPRPVRGQCRRSRWAAERMPATRRPGATGRPHRRCGGPGRRNPGDRCHIASTSGRTAAASVEALGHRRLGGLGPPRHRKLRAATLPAISHAQSNRPFALRNAGRRHGGLKRRKIPGKPGTPASRVPKTPQAKVFARRRLRVVLT